MNGLFFILEDYLNQMVLKFTLAIIIIGIFYLSLSPNETLTVGNDKISHFIAYVCLMLNIGLIAFPIKRKVIIGAIFAILMGFIIEFLQYFVPGRFMSIEDGYANSLGVFLGLLLTLLLGKWIQSLLKFTRII